MTLRQLWVSIAIVPISILGIAAEASAQPAPARETYADLPGVRLWFRDTGGSGTPVVLLHANTGSSQSEYCGE